MKRIYFLKTLMSIFIAMYIANVAVGQNLNRENIKFRYTRLPSQPFPKSITSYWLEMDTRYSYYGNSKTETVNALREAARIPGLKKTVKDGAHLFVRLENFYKTDTEMQEKVEEEKRGDEKVKVTYYYYTFSYKFPLYYEVTLPDEADPVVGSFIENSNNLVTYSTNKYQSRSKLSEYWSNNQSEVVKKLRNELFISVTKNLKKQLGEHFGFTEGRQVITLKKVKKFKSYNYDDVNKAFETAQKAFEKNASSDTLTNEAFRNEMKSAIDMWTKILKEVEPTNKKARINKKIALALYDNLYVGYVLLDQFDEARKTEVAAKAFKKTPIDYYLKGFSEDREQRYNANKGINF